VNADPDIAVLGEVGLGGVKADPHAHSRILRPDERGKLELRADRSEDGASRALEGDEESVARCVDLAPTVRRKRLAQDPPMVGTNTGEGVPTDAPHEIRRSFDVTEEEGDSPAGERRAAHCLRFALFGF
jgi:hypothetical protein